MQRGLIKLSALTIAMGLAAVAQADVTVPSMKGGFNASAEINYLKPYGVDSVFTNSSVGNTTYYYQKDAKFKYGYGLSVGYTLPNTANDIELNFNRYDSKVQSGEVHDLAKKVTDKFGLQVKSDRYDLLLGQYINVGNSMQLKLKGGLSYAKLRASQQSDKTNFGLNYIDTDHKSTFKGFGPTLGLDSTYTFGATGFGMVAGLSTSMLVGKIDYTRTAVTGNADANGVHTNVISTSNYVAPSKSQVVPAFGAKLGLTYERSLNDAYKLGAEAGYKVDSYLNVVGTGANAGEVQNNNSNLTIAGPYLKLKLAAC